MAVITASLAPIAHMHLATAMSAAQESRQQQFSAPHRGAVACDGQRNALVSQPKMHLSHALKLGELGEDQPEGLLHPLVRILLDPIAPSSHIAARDTEKQRTTARFLLQRLVRALTKERKLKLAHGAFHPEQQAIVGMTRVIDPVLVYDDSSDKSAELDQRVPVATVARQPGSLNGEHGADPPLANRRQQALETRPTDATS